MKKKKGVVVFLVMIIAMLLLGYYSYGIVKGTAAKDNDKGVKLGLDLAGGVSITYQVKGDETPSAEDMSDTVYKLQKRVETYSTEAEVYQVGDNRISVEIPGVSDANSILEELGTPGTLEFKTTEGETFMTGEMVADAQAATQSDTTTSGSKYVVQLKLNDEGAKIFSEKTGEYLNKVLPIYYDGECISYPTVQSQITNGEAVISGMSSYEDAEALASQIRSGALKLELEELQSEVVGAKLGSQAIKTSIHWYPDHHCIHADRIPHSGTGSIYCIAYLYRYHSCNFTFISHYTDLTWYCRYYPVHWYGGGCERYYFRTYP